MGWSMTMGASKADIVAERTKGWENEKTKTTCLRKSVVGNVLYAVMETTFKDGRPAREAVAAETGDFARPFVPAKPALPPGGTERWIAVCLLGAERGYGWGSKDMDESAGPCEVSCPLYMLDMVPCPGGYATKWREKVRAYHAAKAENARMRKAIKPGTVLYLPNVKGRKGPFVIEPNRPGKRSLYASIGWAFTRIPPRCLKGAQVYPDLAAYEAAHPEPAVPAK